MVFDSLGWGGTRTPSTHNCKWVLDHESMPPNPCRFLSHLNIELLNPRGPSPHVSPEPAPARRAVWPQKSLFPSLCVHDSKHGLRKIIFIVVHGGGEGGQ